jgi:hypothetical protein
MNKVKTLVDGVRRQISNYDFCGDDFGMMDIMPFFNLRSNPYNLDDHYQFEPLFSTQMPRHFLLKCSRQVGKSLNLAGSETIKSNTIPHFRTLFVCPRFEQIKRLSTLYIQPFITEALIRDLLVDSSCDKSILQRTFLNGSVQYGSFAFLDAERIRSIAVDQVVYDEVQDMNWAFIPIIDQTMGGSKNWGMRRYAGTPKSLDNTIEGLWQRSSKEVWTIECPHMGCNKWNIGCAEMDLLQMIGDRGPICAGCGKALSPEAIRRGGYLSAHPDRCHTFRGLHVTQPLHPFYFEPEQIDKWLELVYNMNTYPTSKFYNECLGESYDSADRLMSSKVIRQMSVSDRRNTIDAARAARSRYAKVAMGIDWGGGGDDSPSFTVITLCGFRHGSDVAECFYAVRLSKNLDSLNQCGQVQMYWDLFRPDYIAHDFGGAGAEREALLVGMGIPPERIIPFQYCYSPNKDVISYNDDNVYQGTRKAYSMDKPRSLVVMCSMIKAGKITFPNYNDMEHLTSDLLNLMEERTPRPRGSDQILITTVVDKSDDFAHALNFAASSLWYTNGAYPDVAEAMALRITIEQLKASNPTEQQIREEDMWNIKNEPLTAAAEQEQKQGKKGKKGTPKFTPKSKKPPPKS